MVKPLSEPVVGVGTFRRRKECSALVRGVVKSWKDEHHAAGRGIELDAPFTWDGESYAIYDCETRGLYGEYLCGAFLYQGKFYRSDKMFERFRKQGVRLVMHNAAYDLAILRARGIYIPPSQVIDTMVLAHYRCNTGSKSLNSLTKSKLNILTEAIKLGFEPSDDAEEAVYGWVFDNHPALMTRYLKMDLLATDKLFQELKRYINPFTEMCNLYVSKWVDTKVEGVYVDEEKVATQLTECQAVVERTEWELRGILGMDTIVCKTPRGMPGVKKSNFPQCKLPWKAISGGNKAAYLESLGVKDIPRTETGRPKMDKDVVKALLLRDDLPAEGRSFLETVKKYEHAAKMVSMLSKLTGKTVHPSFRFIDSGRLSCNNPNLQQIPKPSDKPGGMMREVFIARPGYKLVCGDESGFQLRILAAYIEHALGDRTLSDWFVRFDAGLEKEDLHTFLARIYGLIKPDWDETHPDFKTARGISKNCTFGRIFGAGPHKIAETAFKTGSGQSFKSLKQQITNALKSFDEKVPRGQLNALAAEAIGEGNPTYDWLGRKYSWTDIIADGKLFTKQLVYHIQGLEASLMVMFQVKAQRIEAKYGGRLLFPVHDECVYEFPEDTADLAAKALSKVFSHDVFKLPSGLRPQAEFKTYSNWSESK